jgi:hypothetical protein
MCSVKPLPLCLYVCSRWKHGSPDRQRYIPHDPDNFGVLQWKQHRRVFIRGARLRPMVGGEVHVKTIRWISRVAQTPVHHACHTDLVTDEDVVLRCYHPDPSPHFTIESRYCRIVLRVTVIASKPAAAHNKSM